MFDSPERFELAAQTAFSMPIRVRGRVGRSDALPSAHHSAAVRGTRPRQRIGMCSSDATTEPHSDRRDPSRLKASRVPAAATWE